MSRTESIARRLSWFPCVAILFCLVSFSAQQTVTIQGTVADLDSGHPLPNVLILLSSDAGYFRANSDTAGRFAIEGLTPGDYKAEVTRDGYLWTKRRSGPAAVTITQDLRNLSFRLLKASAITGQILNEHADPDSGILVTALRLEYRNGIHVLDRVPPKDGSRTSTATDRRGEYRLYGLEPGEYYLRAGSGFGATYYPGTTDPNLAVPISVPAGRDLAGVGMTLARATMYSVTVTVAGQPEPTGFLVAGDGAITGLPSIATIRLRDSSKVLDAFNSSSSMLRAIGGNRYRSPLLLPGDYNLAFTSPSRLYGYLAFDIRDRDVDAGTLTLTRGITLNGRIRTAASQVELKPMTLLLSSINGANPTVSNYTTSAGTVTLSNVPEGQYWLEFRTLPRDIYVQSVRYGERPPVVGDIAVGRETEGPLEIVLAMGGTVSGTVRGTRGETLPYSSVLVYPSRGRQHPALFKSMEADKNGAFAFYGMPPGEYRVLAWEDALPLLHEDPAFLSTFEQRATIVTVQDGSSATADVRAILNP